MSFEVVFVFLALIGMITALVMDKMRPGMILLTVVVLFLCAGIPRRKCWKASATKG